MICFKSLHELVSIIPFRPDRGLGRKPGPEISLQHIECTPFSDTQRVLKISTAVKKLTGCSSLKTFISFRIFTIKWRLFIPQHWRRLWDPDPRSEIGKSRSVGRTCRVPKICCCFFLFRSFPVRHTRLLKISFETPVVAKYYDSSPSQVTSLWVNLCDIPEYIINLPREFVNMGESTTVVTGDCKLPVSSI